MKTKKRIYILINNVKYIIKDKLLVKAVQPTIN